MMKGQSQKWDFSPMLIKDLKYFDSRKISEQKNLKLDEDGEITRDLKKN